MKTAVSVITQHHVLIPSQRCSENLSMAKKPLFLLSLFASILDPARKHWSHSMNISLSFQKFFHPNPSRLTAFPLTPLDGFKPQQYFILEEQSLLEQHSQREACCSRSLAVHLPGYSRAGAGEEPRNFSSLVASSEPRKHGLPPSPRLFWSFLHLLFSAHHLSFACFAFTQTASPPNHFSAGRGQGERGGDRLCTCHSPLPASVSQQ